MVNIPLLRRMMKKKRRISKKKVSLLVLIIIFGSALLLSLIKIGSYLKDNRQNRKIEERISNAIMVLPDEKLGEIYRVDFKKLKGKNSDTVAYLKVPDTNIDYVVVKGNDNKYYLDHNYNKNYNVSGWIFADYRNKFDDSDKNIVVYGHNTWDGSMFGSLRKVLDYDWNKDKEKIMFITEEEISYYEVFSTYTIDSEEYYITTNFNSDKEFETFIKTLKFRSFYDFDVDVSSTDKILTLSTCSGDGKKRIVLHAKKV